MQEKSSSCNHYRSKFSTLLWKNVGVPTDTLFQELSPENQKKIGKLDEDDGSNAFNG